MGTKQVIKYIGRGVTRYGKNQRGSIDYGMCSRIFVNKDSPDYKPCYGKTFTERQLKILNEEIPLDEVRLQELSIIKRKAEALGDEQKAEIASFLIGLKTAPEKFEYTVKKEDAKAVLQSLTPWEIKWKE